MGHMNGEKLDPARTVIECFRTSDISGVREVAKITGLDRTSVQKWMWPKTRKGTGGLVPSKYHRVLREEAEQRGIELPSLA